MAFFSRFSRCSSTAFLALSSIAFVRLLATHASHIDTTPATQNPMAFNTLYFSPSSPKSCCNQLAMLSEIMTATASATSATRGKTNVKGILLLGSLMRCHDFEESFI